MQTEKTIAYIALGANLGDPVAALKEALVALGRIDTTEVLAVSSFYRTAPVDSSGPDYVNAVCKVVTGLKAEELLAAILNIENENGRVRPAGVHNAPRTLDLDLLLFGNTVRRTEFLTLPHPRMHQRAFVLVPLTEISPECEIPGLGKAKSFLTSVLDQKIVSLVVA